MTETTHHAVEREPRNGLGLAALICGLIGLLVGIIPIMGWAAAGLGLTGLVLGFAGLGRVRRGRASNKKTTWFGIVLSAGALALGIVGMVIFFGALEQLERDLEDIGLAPAVVVVVQP